MPVNFRVDARRFTLEDQLYFGSFSGDMNPMHVDPVAARRTQAGALVVHGVHAFLWAFNALVTHGLVTASVAAIRVEFRKFIYVESEVVLTIVRSDSASLRAELSVDGLRTAKFELTYGEPGTTAQPYLSREAVVIREPCALNIEELVLRSGMIAFSPEHRGIDAFDRAVAVLGRQRIVAIANLSTLVGMVCPGLHSTFSTFDIAIVPTLAESHGLSFRVRAIDDRFRLVEMDVSGGGINGSLTAFVRPAPIVQPTARELRDIVSRDAFHGTTALIVGGSRGLGALTAAAIAAGSGRVIVTYAVGEADAEAVASQIGRERCLTMRYDAMKPSAPQLHGISWPIDQVYYFATAQIYRQRAGYYDPERFAACCQMYVNGFNDICTALYARNREGLSAFYPSTVYVEERPRELSEYSMAKAAGEILCAEMSRSFRGLRVIVRRLPRLLTDQTATVMPEELPDAFEEILSIVRDMHVK